jgi:hypothetical protein
LIVVEYLVVYHKIVFLQIVNYYQLYFLWSTYSLQICNFMSYSVFSFKKFIVSGLIGARREINILNSNDLKLESRLMFDQHFWMKKIHMAQFLWFWSLLPVLNKRLN